MKRSIWALLGGAKTTKEKLAGPDYDFGFKAFYVLDLLARYFRFELTGLENIPAGPAILVGNHSAGITFFDPMFLGVAWYRQRPGDELVYLVHDAMLAVPGLGTYLRKMGGARASRRMGAEALSSGRKIMVYPGGNYEAFRPYKERYKIDLGGHKGFCRLAIEHGVPVVPVVSVGSHETFFVLSRNEWLARLTRLDKLLRMESFPLILSLPWGISLGPVFHFPLPAKITMRIGQPIPIEQFRNPEATSDCVDENRVEALYQTVNKSMQQIMDEESSKRRFPVLG